MRYDTTAGMTSENPSANRARLGDEQGGHEVSDSPLDAGATAATGAPPVRIAAFDLDGTLLDGQSGTLVLRYLISHHLVHAKTILLASWWGVRYKLHLPHRQSEVREEIMGELKLLPPDRVTQILDDFHEEILVPRYRANGIAEIRRRQQCGEHAVIVSATFDAVAQASRAFLGADAALATIMERDERGWYTGRVQGEVTAGVEKLRRLRAYADERFGAGGWVLERAYGDHYTDVPLLEAARTCVCVNATHTLRNEAERRGWTQVTWG